MKRRLFGYEFLPATDRLANIRFNAKVKMCLSPFPCSFPQGYGLGH